jgi:hypothetical protein
MAWSLQIIITISRFEQKNSKLESFAINTDILGQRWKLQVNDVLAVAVVAFISNDGGLFALCHADGEGSPAPAAPLPMW